MDFFFLKASLIARMSRKQSTNQLWPDMPKSMAKLPGSMTKTVWLIEIEIEYDNYWP